MSTATMAATAVRAPDTAAARVSAPGRLLARAALRADEVALRHKKLGRWREYTWADYARRAARTGLGLLELGVRPGDRVAIHAENRPEWLFANLGAQGIGAIVTGVYPTSAADEVQYLLGHSGARVLIAEDEEQLDKALEVRQRLPALRHIVVIETRGVRDHLREPAILTFAELEALGEQRPLAEWHGAVERLRPRDVATLIYTSGTTGAPKGAMLSHANLMAAGQISSDEADVTADDESLSYLPLSHIAERLFTIIDPLFTGQTVNFGGGGESLASDLREVQPTMMFGVPRVWEKMSAGVDIRMADASWLKRKNFDFWMRRGRPLARKRLRGRPLSAIDRLVYGLGWLLLYRPLRERLGLVRLRDAISGAAPVAPEVLEFFWTIGVPIREGYGQTEGTAIATLTPRDDVRLGAVGRAVVRTEVRIADDGEILVRGPCVFLGYWNDEAATREVLDDDGWLRTGDIGELDEDGFLTITDRKKAILITSGGKNIAPSWIENKLKVSPFVRDAIVVGDARKYLTALIGIERDPVGDWATRHGIAYTTYEDLTEKAEVRALIGEWVEEVNGGLARVQQIKRFALLRKELDHEDGELTATQKVKRRVIDEQFGELIEGLYR